MLNNEELFPDTQDFPYPVIGLQAFHTPTRRVMKQGDISDIKIA